MRNFFNSVSLVLKLSKKFLLSKSSDGFLSLITWVSVLGVSLGVFALVVVTSVINGFHFEIAKAISGLNGDVIVYSRADPVIHHIEQEQKMIATVPEITAIAKTLISELMISGKAGVAGVVLEGIELDSIKKVTTVFDKLESGRLPEALGEIVVAAEVARKTGVKEGETIKMIIPSLDQAPSLLEAKVVGIVRLGFHEYDSKYAFGQLAWLQEITNLPNRVSTYKIKLKYGSNARYAAEKLEAVFGYPLRAKDWSQLNRNLFYAIELEKVVISIILLAIILVAAFNVISALMMMIHDKAKEIAILKAIGLRASSSFMLFIWIGLWIGIVGILVGSTSGLIVSGILSQTRLISLPADIYYISFLPVRFNWNEIFWICLAALGITFFAILIPAMRVSTQSPMDGIRYDS